MQNEEQIEELELVYADDLEKAYNHLLDEYQIIRAGRANPHILDKVMVEYYGVMTPINQMANIQVPEARMIVISVWDSSQLKNVSKAISMADLGVNPTDDGKVIRLVFPPLTEERRKDLAKQVKKLLEETKVVMRNAIRDVFEKYKVKAYYGNLVEYIINRDKTGMCPMEKAVLEADEPNTAYDVLKKKIAEMRKGGH